MSRKQAPIIVRSIKEFVIQKGGRSEADLVEAEDNEHSKADDDHGNDLACLPAGTGENEKNDLDNRPVYQYQFVSFEREVKCSGHSDIDAGGHAAGYDYDNG